MTRSIASWGGARLDETLVLAALCLCTTATTVSAADPVPHMPRTSLVVRVYNVSGLPTRDLREANRVATAALRPAGIDVRWTPCPAAGDAVCRAPLGANEAVLRLIPAAARMTADPASLGSTLLDRQGRQPVLATVFMDRVETVALRAHVDRSRLAGLAMAHELGHLLLNAPGHAVDGLMRAFWTDDALRSTSLADWQLQPDEVQAIRAARARAPDLDLAGGS